MTDPLERVRQLLGGEIESPVRQLRRDNTSGYAGVYRVPSGKWRAELRVDGKKRNLGTFANIDEAIRARQAAEDQTGMG